MNSILDNEDTDAGIWNQVEDFAQTRLESIVMENEEYPTSTKTSFRITHAVVTFYKYSPPSSLDLILKYHSRPLVQREEVSGCIPLHRAKTDAIRKMIRKKPDSLSMPTTEGRLPLHLLLDSPRFDGTLVKYFMKRHPCSCVVQDPITGLYPFMLAAANHTDVAEKARKL